RHGLADHGGHCLDAADAPAGHPEPVDHGGVRVGAPQGGRVGAQDSVDLAHHNHASAVRGVDRVDDAHARGHDLEGLEGGLAPAQELVALTVALVFDVHVQFDGVGGAEAVDLHRVVDDQLGRSQRVDLVRAATEFDDLLTHRGEVDDAGHTG